MADSLRDQLIAAGFEAPKKQTKKAAKDNRGQKSRPKNNKKRPGSPSNKSAGKSVSAKPTSDKSAEAAILERKKLKAQIKELIDNNKLENWKGEIAFRYTVEKRIRELYVNEDARKQLTDREVAITRLNGDTYLVPIAIAAEIITINPQWSVFNNAEDDTSQSASDDDYADYQVPDDIQW